MHEVTGAACSIIILVGDYGENLKRSRFNLAIEFRKSYRQIWKCYAPSFICTSRPGDTEGTPKTGSERQLRGTIGQGIY